MIGPCPRLEARLMPLWTSISGRQRLYPPLQLQNHVCRCIAKLQSCGLKVLCDIVINHRCAQKQDKDGIWNVFGGKMAWDAKAIVLNDRKFKGRGHRATGDEFAAAPNIDHMQDYVRKDLTDWLKWLRSEMGFDGWRYPSHLSS